VSAHRRKLIRFAWLSLVAALLTIALKTAAWWLTSSVGLLSDALESIANLVGALLALVVLTVAARPPDDDHAYGHGKAEYFSSGIEGGLIIMAAVCIGYAAVTRLILPRDIEHASLGMAVSGLSGLVNLGVGLLLLRVGRANDSITLEANARHLLTDVWTTVGVLAGVIGVVLTGWLWLDPVVALLVAAHILWIGGGIVVRSVGGLMDPALPPAELARVGEVLDRHRSEEVQFHALRTRQAGPRRFVSVHVLVPGGWSVQRGHELLETIEADLRAALPECSAFTHLEPLDDPASWEDERLDRPLQ
jgi:cation diffusion facilitator family transporter